MKCSVFVALSLALAASARPKYFGRADFTLQNGKDAIALNQKFATLTPNSPCNVGDNACINNEFAQCVNGKFVLQACASGTVCAALPLVNSPGTSITCATAADRDARIAATGAQAGGAAGSAPAPSASQAPAPSASVAQAPSASVAPTPSASVAPASSASVAPAPSASVAPAPSASQAPAPSGSASVASSAAAAPSASSSAAAGNNAAGGGAAAGGDNSDPQKSLTLLDSVIATKFADDGQDQPTAGQVASLTSTNNFINFCATVPTLNITNGLQIKEGSCNPAPMGVIASISNMPSSKFVFPPNGGTVPANTNFTIKMAIKNLETGNFVNANANYFSAPQVVNPQGNIVGHSHVVIDPLPALDSTTPTDPLNDFVFFKGLNDKDVGGVLSVEVGGGLPAGFYRLASINSAANHQPALVAVAQHGSLDDMVYFTVA